MWAARSFRCWLFVTCLIVGDNLLQSGMLCLSSCLYFAVIVRVIYSISIHVPQCGARQKVK